MAPTPQLLNPVIDDDSPIAIVLVLPETELSPIDILLEPVAVALFPIAIASVVAPAVFEYNPIHILRNPVLIVPPVLRPIHILSSPLTVETPAIRYPARYPARY